MHEKQSETAALPTAAFVGALNLGKLGFRDEGAKKTSPSCCTTINVIQSAEYRLHDDRGAGLQNRNENEETRADRMGIMPPDRRAIAHGKSSKLSRELTRRARCACVPQGRGRSASIFFSGVQNGNEVQAQLLPAWSAISMMTFAVVG
jgi:hypothetical protein